jgi:hypothetical protein
MLTYAPLTLTFPFALMTYLFVAHTLDAPNYALGASLLAGGVTALVGLFCIGLVKDVYVINQYNALVLIIATLVLIRCISVTASTRMWARDTGKKYLLLWVYFGSVLEHYSQPLPARIRNTTSDRSSITTSSCGSTAIAGPTTLLVIRSA